MLLFNRISRTFTRSVPTIQTSPAYMDTYSFILKIYIAFKDANFHVISSTPSCATLHHIVVT